MVLYLLKKLSVTYKYLKSFRSVRNFVIDLRGMPASSNATGLHWQVAQATSLINVVVEMSTVSGNNHQGDPSLFCCVGEPPFSCFTQGIFMENGR
jgi:hypothetical protein